MIIRQVIPNQGHQQLRHITALLQPTAETRTKVPVRVIQEPAGQATPIQDRLQRVKVLLPPAQGLLTAGHRAAAAPPIVALHAHQEAAPPIAALHAHQEAAQLIALHHAHQVVVQVTAAAQATPDLPEAVTAVVPAVQGVPDQLLPLQEAAVQDLPGHLPLRRAEDNETIPRTDESEHLELTSTRIMTLS